MKTRLVIVTPATILALFKDYLGPEHIPEDATPVKLMYNTQERGKLALVFESDQIKAGAPDLMGHFDIRRVYSVGG